MISFGGLLEECLPCSFLEQRDPSKSHLALGLVCIDLRAVTTRVYHTVDCSVFKCFAHCAQAGSSSSSIDSAPSGHGAHYGGPDAVPG